MYCTDQWWTINQTDSHPNTVSGCVWVVVGRRWSVPTQVLCDPNRNIGYHVRYFEKFLHENFSCRRREEAGLKMGFSHRECDRFFTIAFKKVSDNAWKSSDRMKGEFKSTWMIFVLRKFERFDIVHKEEWSDELNSKDATIVFERYLKLWTTQRRHRGSKK